MADMPNVIYVDEMDANWSAKQWDELANELKAR